MRRGVESVGREGWGGKRRNREENKREIREGQEDRSSEGRSTIWE